MNTPEEVNAIERLQELVAGMNDIKDLLDGMTGLAAAALTKLTGVRIACSVTLHRRKRPATITGSSDQAILLDGIEQRLGDGPCLQALQTGNPVLLHNISTETRWPAFRRELGDRDLSSVLAVPLMLGNNASAALAFFAATAGAFSQETIKDAELFRRSRRPGNARRAQDRRGRTPGRGPHRRRGPQDSHRHGPRHHNDPNRCTGKEAFNTLRSASNARNQKLHDVARTVVASIAEAPGAATSNHDPPKPDLWLSASDPNGTGRARNA